MSYDYEVLKRRFDAFMGPNYTTGIIESGIQRITAIEPPYHKAGIDRINKEMLQRAADRETLKQQWRGEVADGSFAVCVETEIPQEKRVPIFVFWNFALTSLIMMVANITMAIPLQSALLQENGMAVLLYLLLMIPASYLLTYCIIRLLLHINPANSMKSLGKAVYQTLRECELIAPSAKIETKADKDLGYVSMYLRNASIHDQNVFNTAMAELLSPIENPRYILISKTKFGGYNYRLSFACPSIIGKKKEYVEVLAEKLKATTGNFEPVYTRREDGRKLILACRKKAYITQNQRTLSRKYKVSHWD